ncbi:ECF transporter S component [[Eubacterium] cellulosolvens]
MSSSRYAYSKAIAGAAIFGALSFVTSALTAPYLPRMPGWGIAFIDPVSIIWIICFLIFGFYTGLLCSIIGTFGLMFFDPFTPIGPVMKFAATLPILLVLYFGLRLKYKIPQGENLKSLRNYIPLCLGGAVIRIIVMTVANILLFTYVLSISYAKFSLGGFSLTSWSAVIFVAVVINAEQSIWDCLLPYLAVHSTKIYDRFRFW